MLAYLRCLRSIFLIWSEPVIYDPAEGIVVVMQVLINQDFVFNSVKSFFEVYKNTTWEKPLIHVGLDGINNV